MVEEASKKAEVPAAEVLNAPPEPVLKPSRKPKALPGKGVPDVAMPPEQEKNKVIHIVRRLHEEANQKRTRKRQPWLVISLVAAGLAGLHDFGVPGIQVLLPIALWIVAAGSMVTLVQRVVTVRRESAEADAAGGATQESEATQ